MRTVIGPNQLKRPIEEKKMFANRLFTVLVVLALGVVILFTFRQATATTAIAQADRSYDQVEQGRASRSSANLPADRSYDQIEALRAGAALPLLDHGYDQVETLRGQRGAWIADRSYDAIENLRAARGTK
jgi:hypothetical protein